MAHIKGVDTGPEMFVRRALHARGYRYRVHGSAEGWRVYVVWECKIDRDETIIDHLVDFLGPPCIDDVKAAGSSELNAT